MFGFHSLSILPARHPIEHEATGSSVKWYVYSELRGCGIVLVAVLPEIVPEILELRKAANATPHLTSLLCRAIPTSIPTEQLHHSMPP